MGGDKKNPYVIVVDYFATFMHGICAGPATLLEIRVKDKVLWSGEVSDYTTVNVDKPKLFGGDKKEGGMSGKITIMPGKDTQQCPPGLAAMHDTTPDKYPAFRGYLTVFYGRKFRVAINNPYWPDFRYKVRRYPSGGIGGDPIVTWEGEVVGANPAHCIAECLTNNQWGMGADATSLDTASFQNAAQILRDEGFGINLLWTNESRIQDFIENILSHINGVLYIHPETGKFYLKLLRDDYGDPSLLPTIDPSNAKVVRYERKGWGEIINEVTIKYTDPKRTDGKQASTTFQDLAAIAQAGQIVSQTNEYLGITDDRLVADVGGRDIRQASTPLASMEVVLDRRFWNIVPGDVVNFSWPEYNVGNIVCRVFEVNYGKPDDSKIRVKLTEDIFSYEKSTFVTLPSTTYDDTIQPPTQFTDVKVISTPYFVVSSESRAMDADQSYVTILCSGDNNNAYTATLWGTVTYANGTSIVDDLGTIAMFFRKPLDVALVKEISTTIDLGPDVDIIIEPGDIGIINDEIVMFDVDQGNNVWTVQRGMHDTVPAEHAVGDYLWIGRLTPADWREHLVNESHTYYVTPSNPSGELHYTQVPPLPHTFTDRIYRPYRPGNVKVNNISALQNISLPNNNSIITVTWANRNRTLQDTIYTRWDDPNEISETGQTTVLTLKRNDGTVITTVTKAAGVTSHTFPANTLQNETSPVTLEVHSERDGYVSWQKVVTQLSWV